ncbi:DUF3298 and DUF4163 domain-containing protein [Brevibacillus sp. SYSU BS000544]|uniref:DUF3298 and DUF4163 domain-containing protein n=1 Tax=Brevibacillus sp. SYSU BS000544 TaxID=3416443 RepID=UPI003CE5615A
MPEASTRATILEKRYERPRLHLRYPKIQGLSNPFAEQKINHTIQQLLFSLIRDQGYANPVTDITATYKVRLNKNGVLSITYEVYSYTQGAAHGLTVMKSTTFQLETGKLVSFESLFKPNSKYRSIINAKIKSETKENQVPLIKEFVTISPDQDYYLTDDALIAYFQLYEYTSYAYGFPEFSIPFSYLKPVINPYGPIPKIMRS